MASLESSQALTFDRNQVLYLNTLPIPQLESPTQAVVELLAAPINPIDQLALLDAYPVKPQVSVFGLPVPGYDGVARVKDVGSEVRGLKVGDHALVKRHGLGTWRTHASLEAADLMPVNSDLDPALAAILRMSAVPAYYLLEENSKHLKVGDWIVHTAATGVIGHFITQLAKRRGWKVISVIRTTADGVDNTESFESTVKRLRGHGADVVVSEADLNSGRSGAPFAGKRIMLALDAVGGTVAESLIGVCSPGAVYTTYGFLGTGNVQAPMRITPANTWADGIVFKGFRISRALAGVNNVGYQDLVDWLAAMLLDGSLTAPRLESVVWNRSDENVLENLRRAVASDADKTKIRKIKTIIVFQ